LQLQVNKCKHNAILIGPSLLHKLLKIATIVVHFLLHSIGMLLLAYQENANRLERNISILAKYE